MSRFVVDASVVRKWFVPEVHTEAALRLLDDPHDLLAPDLVFPEAANTLWKKIGRSEFTTDEAREILRALPTLPITIHSSSSLVEPGFEIAAALNRTVYDSLYLALALLTRCRMVTADRRLHAAIQRSPFGRNVLWIEDPL